MESRKSVSVSSNEKSVLNVINSNNNALLISELKDVLIYKTDLNRRQIHCALMSLGKKNLISYCNNNFKFASDCTPDRVYLTQKGMTLYVRMNREGGKKCQIILVTAE